MTTKPKTIQDLFSAYINALPGQGKSASTAKSYAGDLTLAEKHLGSDSALSTLTMKATEEYFASDAVNLKRNGTPKNKITTDKIKRVFRLAMVWAEDEGFLKLSPIPTTKKEEPKKPSKPILKKPAKEAK